jgi:site-specific recombinase XerD
MAQLLDTLRNPVTLTDSEVSFRCRHSADTGFQQMAERLTDRLVKGLPAPATGNKLTRDDLVRGFAARTTAAGAKAFVLDYRRKTDGLKRRITIGGFPDWTTQAAREEAKRLKREIDGGADPVGQQRADREAPTVNDLCDRFVSDYLPRKRASTQADYQSMLRTHVRPGLGKRKVAALTYADVDGVHRTITKRSGPYRGNRVLALVSKLCSLAVQWHWRTDNPCKGIERNVEDARKRYLTGAELERLSKALAEHDDQDAADIFRLLLLTGARRGEVLAARRVDFDPQRGVWTKPGATTKRKSTHVVPLSPAALQIIAARELTDSEFLFPGRNGVGHRVEVKANWRRVCKAAKISNLRVHDLRHSFASIAASSGVSLHAIGGLLGHTNPVTTARYSHLFDDHLREATTHVGAVITGGKSAKVVPLK